MSGAGPLAGVRGRDFSLLWFGETASALGSSVTALALPLVALTQVGAGVVAIGVLEAVAWLPWLVIGLPAGAWVDRLSPRRIMIWCDVVSIVAFASIPAAALAGALTLAQLVVVAAAVGVAKVFFSTSYRAMIPTLVGEGELVTANARLQGAESAATIGGPGVGGLLAQLVGAANALLVDAVSFAVSLGCLLRMRPDTPRPITPRRRLRDEVAEGVRIVVRDRLLRTFAINGACANLALTGANVLVVVFLVQGVGLGAGAAGLLIAVAGAGGVLGALVAPRLARRVGTARALLIFTVAGPASALLVPFTGTGAAAACFVVGDAGLVAACVAGNVIRASFVQGYCPRELFGRVTTTQQVVNYGAIPLGAVLGGALGAGLGYRSALVVVFLGYLASTLLLVCSPVRRLRDLPTRLEAVSDPAGRIAVRDRRRRRADPRGPRPRAARRGLRRAGPGLHPRRRGDGQDPRHHASHRLRGAFRGRPGRAAARRHLHRPRRR